jgi:acetolactate synthase-1/2/3 large subunit
VHRFLRDKADLIVAVGTGLNMMTCQPIQEALRPERLAVVNIDMGEVLRAVTPVVYVEADAGVVFSKLNQLCEHVSLVPRSADPVPVVRYTPQLAPELPPFDPRDDKSHAGLLQSDALEILQRYLPKAGHILFDAGNCAAAALHYLRIPPGVSTTCALGMGGMGYSIAGAVGAQLGSPPGSRTMVFCGDGAFLMQGAEVNTAVQYQLPILFVVFNNGMHGMCATRQQLYFDGRIEGSQYPTVSVTDVARGMGSRDRLWVGSAKSNDELSRSLCDYFSRADRPGVLELRLGQEQIPPFTPFLSHNAPTYHAAPLVEMSPALC